MSRFALVETSLANDAETLDWFESQGIAIVSPEAGSSLVQSSLESGQTLALTGMLQQFGFLSACMNGFWIVVPEVVVGSSLLTSHLFSLSTFLMQCSDTVCSL